jgi:Flp pilus assembly protein TadD
MSNPLRTSRTVSAFVLASMLAGCATPQQKTGFGGRTDADLGAATKAMMALNAGDSATAIDFAERAVAKNPDDAGFRALLGNAYFKAGRFASAEAAYKDALTLYSNQPQVILKLALVETALGKKNEAVAFLQAGRDVLDASNYGLAMTLAGRPADAIPVLEAAARVQGADATVRQNLALAHAFAGDWTEARTIAAQDVPGDQIDARIHQWMQLASPKTPSAQVAALTGVTPAAVDQGQPVRLALRNTDTMMAQAAPAAVTRAARPATPVVAAAPVSAEAQVEAAKAELAAAPAEAPMSVPQPQIAQATPAMPAPSFVEAVSDSAAPEAAPAIAAKPLAPKPVAPAVVAEASLPLPVAMLAAAAKEVPSLVKAFMPKKAVAVHHAKAKRIARPRVGPGDSIVQLGSYRSEKSVDVAWNTLTKRHPALRAYLPLRARFSSPKGVFYRLSIQGFGNQREAISRCQLLKSNGGQCFVRPFAGDAPVQIAMN